MLTGTDIIITMKKLHTFHPSEQPLAGMFKELLASEGIQCLIRNERLLTGMGEIPFVECFPELWVVDEETYPRAILLLRAWLEKPADTQSWTCPGCREEIAGHFTVCWSCGRLRC